MLQESIGNTSCRTTMIAHVSPSLPFYAETLATVQLATRLHRLRRRKGKVSTSSKMEIANLLTNSHTFILILLWEFGGQSRKRHLAVYWYSGWEIGFWSVMKIKALSFLGQSDQWYIKAIKRLRTFRLCSEGSTIIAENNLLIAIKLQLLKLGRYKCYRMTTNFPTLTPPFTILTRRCNDHCRLLLVLLWFQTLVVYRLYMSGNAVFAFF